MTRRNQSIGLQVFPVAASARVVNTFNQPRPGSNRHGGRHHGVDILARVGSPIRSATDGTVETVSTSGPGGNMIIIRAPNGLYHGYAHMKRRPRLERGDRVQAGQFLGLVGMTGNTRGPHLHFQTAVGPSSSSRRLDPTAELQALQAAQEDVRAERLSAGLRGAQGAVGDDEGWSPQWVTPPAGSNLGVTRSVPGIAPGDVPTPPRAGSPRHGQRRATQSARRPARGGTEGWREVVSSGDTERAREAYRFGSVLVLDQLAAVERPQIWVAALAAAGSELGQRIQSMKQGRLAAIRVMLTVAANTAVRAETQPELWLVALEQLGFAYQAMVDWSRELAAMLEPYPALELLEMAESIQATVLQFPIRAHRAATRTVRALGAEGYDDVQEVASGMGGALLAFGAIAAFAYGMSR